MNPHCPTCEPRRLLMALERQRYIVSEFSQLWKCHFCGTTVEMRIPCIISEPDDLGENCTTAAAGAESAPTG